MDRAVELLKQAKGSSHRISWLRVGALHFAYRGELSESLKRWQHVVQSDPLDIMAHRRVAEILLDIEGPEAAIAHLRTYVKRFPQSYGLRFFLIELLRGEDTEAYESELREFMKIHPDDAWAIRELAFAHLQNRNYEQAEALAHRSEEIDPNHPASMFARGRVDQARGDLEAAKQHYRDAIKISVDYEFATMGLISCCDTKAERAEELEFVYQQLKTQSNDGDVLISYRENASRTLENDTLLQRLKDANTERPDLWQSWSVLAAHLSDMQRHEEAVKVAKKATQRFPLLPRSWIDLGAAYAACGNIDGEISALMKAKQINQNWGEPARLLAKAYEKKGDLAAARTEIERVLVAEPREVLNLGALAKILWAQDQKQEAVDKIVTALEIHPGYEWGWSALRAWSHELEQYENVIEITRRQTEQRPKKTQSWLLFAESLAEREQIDQAVEALDKAISLNPRSIEAYSQKAYQLTRAGRFDDAINACRPAVFGENTPIELKSRLAWVEGERGNIEKAIRLMEDVVNQDNDYFWAWYRLAEWYEFTEQDDKYYKASKQMARLDPLNAVSWGYLGMAELLRDNTAEAKKHFLQAVQLSPAYSFGSGKLIDLHLNDKSYDEALQVVDLIEPHIGDAWALSERVRIESLREDKKASINHLRKLAVTPADDSTALDSAVESLYMAGWGDEVMPLIDELLDHPDAQPGVAYVFINLGATLKTWDRCQKRLDGLRNREAIWREGAMKLLEEYATGDEPKRLAKFIAQHRDEFHRDNELWNAVANAYNAAGQHQNTLKWMDGWQSRKGLSSAFVFPHVQALWRLNKPHDAAQAGMHVFQNYEPDASTGAILTMLAYYQLIYGSLESCVDAISMVDANQLPRFYQLIFQHIVALLENLSTQGRYAEVDGQLKSLWAGLPKEVIDNTPLLKRVHWNVRARAAELHGKKLTATMIRLKSKIS
ncbi:MAG: tetratricopeptide repeat protein [Planctomycetota bacterium]